MGGAGSESYWDESRFWSCCVDLGKSLNLPESRGLHLCNGNRLVASQGGQEEALSTCL